MVNVSKGDILVEPLGFVIEILIRIFGKSLAHNFTNESINHWEISQILSLFGFLGIIGLVIFVNFWFKKKNIKIITKLSEYIPAATIFSIGLIVFLSSRSIRLPSEEKLTKVSGNLVSVKSIPIGRHSVRILRIENQEILFGYSSMGRSCGNVYEKLVKKQGENISVKFDSQHLVKSKDLPDYYNIYDIWSGNIPICTYWDINEMYEKEYRIGLYFGLGMMFFSILIILNVIPLTPHSRRTPNGSP